MEFAYRVSWPGGFADASVFCSKWNCSFLLEMELRELGKRDKSWEDIHIFGFEEGRSATEISTAIRLMAATAKEWAPNSVSPLALGM